MPDSPESYGFKKVETSNAGDSYGFKTVDSAEFDGASLYDAKFSDDSSFLTRLGNMAKAYTFGGGVAAGVELGRDTEQTKGMAQTALSMAASTSGLLTVGGDNIEASAPVIADAISEPHKFTLTNPFLEFSARLAFSEERKKELEEMGYDNKVVEHVEKLGKTVAEWGEAGRDYFTAIQERPELQLDPEIFSGEFQDNPSWTRASTVIAQALVSLGAAASVSALTRSPKAGAVFLGLVESEEVYHEAREKGLPQAKRNALFATAASGSIALEIFGMDAIFKGAGNTQLAKKLLKGKYLKKVRRLMSGTRFGNIVFGGMFEGGQEAAQNFWINMVVKYGLDSTRGLFDGTLDAVIGGVGSGSGVGTFTPISPSRQRLYQRKAAKKFTDVEKANAANTIAEEISTKPDKYDKIIEDSKKNPEPVKSDLEILNDERDGLIEEEVYNLKEQDPNFGKGDNLVDVGDGKKIRVKLPDNLKHPDTGKKPANEKQWRELAVYNLENGRSQKELIDHYSEVNEATKIAEKYEQDRANQYPAAAQQIKTKMVTPKDKGGMGLSEEDAAAQLAVFMAGAKTFAGKRGESVQQWFERVKPSLEVGGEKVSGKNVLNQDQVQSPEFQNWFKESKVVDEEGNPLVVYHGTTHDFKAFDRDKLGNSEGHYGKGFYFTDSIEDVNENYASIEGADLTNRIEQRAERIQQELEDAPEHEGKSWDELMEIARPMARKELSGEKPNVMPVYLSLQNPVVVQEKGGTFFEMETEFDEDGELIDESGDFVELLDSVRSVANQYNDVDGEALAGEIAERGYDYEGISAYDFEQIVRKGENGAYITDEDGNLANGDFISDVYSDMGIDGIIQDADSEFGNNRTTGKAMAMDYGTKHYIVFDPNDIKSAIGNKGTFDPDSPNILEQGSERGSIEFKRAQTVIRLYENADASTFLHETGHLFMREMQTAIKEGVADEQMQKDYQALVDFVGGDIKSRESQEKLARAFESYLREGVAPTKELQSAFAKFKKWLREIYRSFEELGIRPSLEVKEVFGRMLSNEKGDNVLTDDFKVVPITEETLDEGLPVIDYGKGVDGYMNALKQARKIRKAKSMTKQEIKRVQTEVIKAIDKSDLTGNDKAKFIKTIKNVQTERQLDKALPEIRNRIKRLEDAESGRNLQKRIKKELKTTKAKKQGGRRVGKYDYESNKIFEDLRKYQNMSQEEAQKTLDALPEPENHGDLVRRRFLNMQANGSEATAAVKEAVLRDVLTLKDLGKALKDEATFEKRMNREENINEVLDIMNDSKADAKKIKTNVVNLYRKHFANIWSMLNSMYGKKVADQYNTELVESDMQEAIFFKNKQMSEDIGEIYDVEPSQIDGVFADMSKDKFNLVDKDGVPEEIDRMGLIDIYNSLKNEHTKEAFYKEYGEEQLTELLSNLDSQERALADYLMDSVQEYWEVLNQRSIETTGMDIGRVDNYWMRSSEHHINVLEDMRAKSETPSAAKMRAQGHIVPKVGNAWFKVQRHIAEAEHVRHISRSYEQMKRVFSDRRVRKTIINKFGKPVYDALDNKIENMSLQKQNERLDETTKLMGKMLNNWVTAKIAMNPSVFAKQLISVGNYMENMSSVEWTKYFMEGVANPKKTLDFMWQNIPYLEARYGRGYSEAIQRALEEAGKVSKFKNNWAKSMSSLVRMGDIGAIIYGGYPMIRAEMEKNGGKLTQEAIDKFRQATIRSQQSGLTSSLSDMQNSKNPLTRLFLAFKNTPTQYMRKLVDAQISFYNGDINAQQYAKTMAIYGFVQPSLYAFAGMAMRGLLYGSEMDDEEVMAEWLLQLALNPFNAIPLFNGVAEAMIRKTTGNQVYGAFSLPMITDVERATQKLTKKNVEIGDVLESLGIFAELGTGAPIVTSSKILNRVFGD